MKICIAYILLLFVVLSGCSSSVESTIEAINNVKSSRYHYIPHLDSYIIIPDNFTIKDSMGAINSETGGYLSWVRKSYGYTTWVSEIESYYLGNIAWHREHEPGLVENYKRVDLLINETRASLLTCECYNDNLPDKQLTHRLIVEHGNQVDEFVGNVDFGARQSVEDSILFSLRSLIP